MKSIRSSLWCSSPLNLKHIKNDICKSFAFQVCRGTHGKKTTSKVSSSSHNCVKSFYPPRLLVRKLKKKTQTKFVKLISTHSVGRKQESGDITREPPNQNESDKRKSEQDGSRKEMSQDPSCQSIPTYLFSNFSLPTFSDLENSFSIFSSSSNWKTPEEKDLNVEMCMDVGVPQTVVTNDDTSYRNSLLDLINNNEKTEETDVKSDPAEPNTTPLEPQSCLQTADYYIVEEEVLGSTPSEVIWKTATLDIGPEVGTKVDPLADVKVTVIPADRPKHYWNKPNTIDLINKDIKTLQEEITPLFTPNFINKDVKKLQEEISPLFAPNLINKDVKISQEISPLFAPNLINKDVNISQEIIPLFTSNLINKDVKKFQEGITPPESEKLELSPCSNKVENTVSHSSIPEISEWKPSVVKQESLSFMTPIEMVHCSVKEGEVALVTTDSKSNRVSPSKVKPTDGEPNLDQEQFNPTSIVSIMNMIKDTDQMICSDSNSFDDFLKKGFIEKLPVSSPEPTSVLNILNSVDKSAVIIQNDHHITNHILDTLNHKGNEMNIAKDKLKTTSRDFMKFNCGKNEKLARLKENYEKFKKETNGVEQELNKLDNSLNDDLLLLNDKNHLSFLKKASEQAKEVPETKILSNTDFTLLDNKLEKNLLHLISRKSKNNLFNDNVDRENEQMDLDNNTLEENMLLERNNENDQILTDTSNVQLSCQGLNSFSCSPSQKITINHSRQSHDSAKKSQEGKLNVDVATKTVISSSSKASGSEISIVEVQKFTDKRLPFPFSTETVLQVFGTKEKLTEALSVIEQSKAKVAVLNSSDGHKKGNQASPAFHNMLTSLKSFDEKKDSPIPLIVPVDVVNSTKQIDHPLSSELLMRQAKHAELVKLARSISASNKAMKIAFTNKPKRIVIRKNQNKMKKAIPKMDNERRPFKESVEKVKIIGPKQIDLILGLSPKESVAKRKSIYFQTTGAKKLTQHVKMSEEKNVTERIKDVEKSQNKPNEKWFDQKNVVKPVAETKPMISTTPNKRVDAKTKALVTSKADEEDGLSLRDRTILKDILDGKYGYQNTFSNKLSKENISTSSNVKKGSSSGKGNGDEPTDDVKMSKMLIEKIKKDSCGPILGNRDAIKDCDTTAESERSKTPPNNNQLSTQNHEMGNLKTSDLNKQAQQHVKNEPNPNKPENKPVIQKVATNIMTNLKKQSSTPNITFSHINDSGEQNVYHVNQFSKQPSKQEIFMKPAVGMVETHLPKSERYPVGPANSGVDTKAHDFSKPRETVKPEIKTYRNTSLPPRKESDTDNVKVSVFIPNSNRKQLSKNNTKVEASQNNVKVEASKSNVKVEASKSNVKVEADANKTSANIPIKYNKFLFLKPSPVVVPPTDSQNLAKGKNTYLKKINPSNNYNQINNREVVKSQPTAKPVLAAHEQLKKPQTAPTGVRQSAQSKLNVAVNNLKDEGKTVPSKHPLFMKLSEIKPQSSEGDLKKHTQATAYSNTRDKIKGKESEIDASHASAMTKDNVEPKPPVTVSHTPPVDLSHEFMFNFDKFSKETTPFLDPSLCKECLVAEHRIMGFPMLNPARTDYVIKQGVISVDIATNLMLKKQLKGIPSVTTILNSTMGDASKAALTKWRTTMINQLGEVGFKDFYKEQLKKGSDFHGSVHRFLKTLAAGRAEEASSLTFKSVRDVLNNISEVSVLESQVIHPQLGYRGVVDCVAKYKGIPVVIEWKRSDKPKPTVRHTFDAPLQLSAYIGALNFDKMYNIQVEGAIVVVAYSDGTKADVFNVNLEECKEYWRQWLGRFKTYILANQRFLSPIS